MKQTTEPKYISFHTPDFDIPAERLERTAKQHNIDLYSVSKKKDTSWRGMVRLKPKFILDCMKKFEDYEAIVWIDADSMFIKNPGNEILPPRKDLVSRIWARKGGTVREPIASVIAIRNSPKMRIFVQQWVENTKALKPETQRPEQRTLTWLMKSVRGVKKAEFPPTLVMQKWIGPHKDGADKSVASIWTTRWFGHDAKRSEHHAYVEKQHREDGIWTHERWEYGV